MSRDSKLVERINTLKEYIDMQGSNLDKSNAVSIEAMANTIKRFHKCLDTESNNNVKFKSKINYKDLIKNLTGNDMSLHTVCLNFTAIIQYKECVEYYTDPSDNYYFIAPVKTKIYCKEDFDLSKKYSMEDLKKASKTNEIFLTDNFATIDAKKMVLSFIDTSKEGFKTIIDTGHEFNIGSIKYDPKKLGASYYYPDTLPFEHVDEIASDYDLSKHYECKYLYDCYQTDFVGNELTYVHKSKLYKNFKKDLKITDLMSPHGVNTNWVVSQFVDCNQNAIKIIKNELIKVLDNELTLRENNTKQNNEQER